MDWLSTNFSAELIGTMILVLFGDGVCANVLLNKSKGQNSGWIVITMGWGMGVTMGIFVTGWVSGAHLNPAVTFAMVVSNHLPLEQALSYFCGQFIGGAIGAYLVFVTYRSHWGETEDPNLKLAVFCTMPAIMNKKHNFVVEFIGTAVLLIGVLGISNSHNGLSGGVGPISVGLLVLAIGLSLGGPTGYAINPARDLAPRIMHAILPIPGKRDSGWDYAWIPVLAPLLGGATGAFIYEVFCSTFWQ